MAQDKANKDDTEQNEETANDDQNQEIKEVAPSKPEYKLPLARKYYVKLEDLLTFLYPTHVLHPNSTLRLFLYAEYGPLYNHHSYQCLCNQCRLKCKQIRKDNDIAKQLYYGKLLIGTKECPLYIDQNQTINPKLSWLCDKCIIRCSTVFNLKSGPKNLHIVSDSELTKMEQEIKRKDLLSMFVSRKEELENPLTVEEEEELIQRQPLRVKHVPKLTKQQIIDIFSQLPTYKLPKDTPKEPTPEPPAEDQNQDDPENSDNADDANKPKQEQQDNKKSEKEKENTDKDNENENENGNNEEMIENEQEQANIEEAEEEEEGDEVVSFYDISAVVRKVRNERKKDLFRRSVTTQDPSKKGPKNRTKGLNTTALRHTSIKRGKTKNKLSECEESSVLSNLLHTYTHEIATLSTASVGDVTQNVRLLRYLKKDNQTNWDSNCCLRNSNRLTNDNNKL